MAPDDEEPKSPDAEAVRLGLFALVRQKAWAPLASAVLDANGRPVSAWWPVAFALQRIGDPRALPALRQLAAGQGRYTRAFAARGLGARKDREAVPLLLSMLARANGDAAIAFTAIHALGQTGAPDVVQPILAVLTAPKTDAHVRREELAALGAMKSADALPAVQDLLTDDSPALRAAAVRATAAIDPGGVLMLLSGMEPDPHWIVRAAIAEILGETPQEAAVERLRGLLDDQDKRVVAAALDSLTRLRAPGVDALLVARVQSADAGVRAAAARGLGEIRSPGGAAALRDAYHAWQADDTALDAREAALVALAQYGPPEAADTLKTALADKDWSVRLRAAGVLHKFDPAFDALHAIRPAPGPPIAPYDAPDVVNPQVSPHAFI